MNSDGKNYENSLEAEPPETVIVTTALKQSAYRQS